MLWLLIKFSMKQLKAPETVFCINASRLPLWSWGLAVPGLCLDYERRQTHTRELESLYLHPCHLDHYAEQSLETQIVLQCNERQTRLVLVQIVPLKRAGCSSAEANPRWWRNFISLTYFSWWHRETGGADRWCQMPEERERERDVCAEATQQRTQQWAGSYLTGRCFLASASSSSQLDPSWAHLDPWHLTPIVRIILLIRSQIIRTVCDFFFLHVFIFLYLNYMLPDSNTSVNGLKVQVTWN